MRMSYVIDSSVETLYKGELRNFIVPINLVCQMGKGTF